MSIRPIPYPSDTRAKGWRFEIDHERIRQSDTWALASNEIRPWLLMLWMVAWEQTPCASLPNEDELIAARIGMSPKLFAKHKSILLRGWWEAEDGRLYHSTMVERVVCMLNKRVKDAKRTADNRKRKSESHDSHTDVTRDTDVTHDYVTGESQASSTPEPEPEPIYPVVNRGGISTSPAGENEKPSRSKTVIPPDFEPDEANKREAGFLKVDLRTETLKFTAHYLGTGEAKADWQAVFRKWILNAMQYNADAAKRSTGPPGETEKDRSRREAYEVLTGRRANEQAGDTYESVANRVD